MKKIRPIYAFFFPKQWVFKPVILKQHPKVVYLGEWKSVFVKLEKRANSPLASRKKKKTSE